MKCSERRSHSEDDFFKKTHNDVDWDLLTSQTDSSSNRVQSQESDETFSIVARLDGRTVESEERKVETSERE